MDRVSRSFGGMAALTDINLSIRQGQIVVVIGGSGAGKTTLLKILIGLDRPSSGHVWFNGADLSSMGELALNKARKKFGMVFQYSALLDSMTVFDNVAFPLREHTKLSSREIRHKVIEKLEILNLHDVDRLMPSELSGGMKKRVGLARALMLEPEVLLYDEPTSGLDPLSSRMVDELIADTRSRFGVTSIIISHDMTGALQIADSIVLLADGRVKAAGTPEELVDGRAGLAQDFFRASGIDAPKLVSNRRHTSTH
jgi:phospholipid/cholesterol/gamma-HCH transport system ATP-binding protein